MGGAKAEHLVVFCRGPLYRGQGHEEVHKQMELLGKDHVGYSSKRFTAASGQRFSVVGARPFSDVRAHCCSIGAGIHVSRRFDRSWSCWDPKLAAEKP